MTRRWRGWAHAASGRGTLGAPRQRGPGHFAPRFLVVSPSRLDRLGCDGCARGNTVQGARRGGVPRTQWWRRCAARARAPFSSLSLSLSLLSLSLSHRRQVRRWRSAGRQDVARGDRGGRGSGGGQGGQGGGSHGGKRWGTHCVFLLRAGAGKLCFFFGACGMESGEEGCTKRVIDGAKRLCEG